jgi:hypothetical protein
MNITPKETNKGPTQKPTPTNANNNATGSTGGSKKPTPTVATAGNVIPKRGKDEKDCVIY